MTGARGAVALAAVLCLVAGAFAAAPLFVPGLALLLVAAVGGIWVWLAARGASVTRVVDRASVQEGGPFGLRIFVGRAPIPPPGAELRAWEDGPALAVPRAGEQAVSTTIRLARRGRHRLGPASLEIADPLGLWRRTARSAADEVLVLPRVEPVELFEMSGPAGRWHGAGAGAGAGSAEAGATDVDSLQPYRPGTPASRIHWPTVARSSNLMERRLVAEADRLPLVVVDPRRPESAEALDRAVRAAASLCVHLARRGGCTLALPGDRRAVRIDAELYGFAEAHARLALLAPDAGEPPLGALTGAATLLWVSAAPAPAGLPTSVRYLISPHRQPRWPARFAVAGCRGYELEASASWSLAV